MPSESSGLIVASGTHFGDGNQIRLDRAGNYHLVRWDPLLNQSWHRHVRITEGGSLLEDPWQTSQQPPLSALLKTWHNGQPVMPHVSVSWGMADLALRLQRLAEPPGWAQGSLSPHRLASNLSIEMVRACDALLPSLHVPSAFERDALYEAYLNPMWYLQQGSLAIYPRGQQRQAIFLLLP